MNKDKYVRMRPENFPTRTELRVKPLTSGDTPKERMYKGWRVEEIHGIAIVNEWIALPWYRKLLKDPVYWSGILLRRFSSRLRRLAASGRIPQNQKHQSRKQAPYQGDDVF